MSAHHNDRVERYLGIIAGCLARDLLEKSMPSGATTLQKAEFLESLGFSRDESAIFVGSSPKSIAELARQRKKAKSKAKKKVTKGGRKHA